MNKSNPFYREIKSTSKVTPAEATIAWFYSGRKQPIINIESRFPVYANGIYDCTKKIQAAIDNAAAYLPEGKYQIANQIFMKSGL